MITFTDKEVIISRETWEKYRKDDYFREVLDILEDSVELEEAIENCEEMIDFKEFDRLRRERKLQNTH